MKEKKDRSHKKTSVKGEESMMFYSDEDLDFYEHEIDLTALKKRQEEQAKKAKRDIVKTATEYINTHYNQNLTLHDVAQKCYCNPNYLSGLFQKKLKLNFLQYLNIVRVNNAKTLLLIRGMPISEIAERVGFTTATGFIKAYKKQEGITPYQSRKQMLS